MPLRLVPIVEGEGEEQALPLLLRRLLTEKFTYTAADVEILHPKNARGCGRLTAENGLERYLHHALHEDCDGVLVLLDNDPAIRLHESGQLPDACAPALAHYLAHRAAAVYRRKPVVIVVARWEYEAWFLASLETVGAVVGLSPGLSFQGDVESVRGVKEWLNARLPSGRRYSETLDQPTMTQHLNFELVEQRSRSFQRLIHALEQLIEASLTNTAVVTPLEN